jgi:hypothetical protein|eukprot:SAG25_NODE_150_length_13701_cov_6.145640_9_plen_56_part_00
MLMGRSGRMHRQQQLKEAATKLSNAHSQLCLLRGQAGAITGLKPFLVRPPRPPRR